MISVIIPTLGKSVSLAAIRAWVRESPLVREIILVVPAGLKKEIETRSKEISVVPDYSGRGFALLAGARAARSQHLLFLHDDTWLPDGWDALVAEALTSTKTVGGAFRMQFHPEPPLLGTLRKLGNLFTAITHEFWGDHCIFVRRELVLSNPEVLEVPILEDVRLSRLMRKAGKTVLLPAYVHTDPSRILENGIIRQSLKNVFLRMAYSLGVSPRRIYHWYYG